MKQGVWERLDGLWPTATVARVADRLRSPLARAVGRVGAAFGALLFVAAYVGLLLWHDSAVSTHWLQDELYIINAAWTVHAGFVPNVDFVDRYGGLLTRVMAIGISLSGTSMKAFDYTLAMLLVGCTAMLAVVSARRLPPTVAIGALLVVVALIVTRAPLEQPFQFKTASYATIYNRLAWVMLFVAYIVATVPRAGGREWPSLAVAGFATAVMLLTKFSFVLGVPAVAAAFLLRGAWRECVGWVVATLVVAVVFWLVFAISPAAWLRLIGATAQLGGAAPPGAGLVKLIFLVAYNGAAVAAILLVSALLIGEDRVRAAPLVVATLVMLVLSFGIAVSTGDYPLHDGTSPAMAMMAVVILANLHRRDTVGPAYWFPLWFCVLSLALPHLANGAWASSRGTDAWGIKTTDAGALNALSIRPAAVIRPIATPPQVRGAGLAQDLALFHSLDMFSEQERLLVIRDGLRELVRLPGYKHLGIFSPGARIFPFILGAKPITSVDHWSTPVEFADPVGRSLPADIDVIAVVRFELIENWSVTQPLLRRASRDFTLCRQSALWNIYLRRSAATRQASLGCDRAGWADLVPATLLTLPKPAVTVR